MDVIEGEDQKATLDGVSQHGKCTLCDNFNWIQMGLAVEIEKHWSDA